MFGAFASLTTLRPSSKVVLIAVPAVQVFVIEAPVGEPSTPPALVGNATPLESAKLTSTDY